MDAQPTCETNLGGATTALVATLSENHFLVVRVNELGDVSYGRDSNDIERAAAQGGDVFP